MNQAVDAITAGRVAPGIYRIRSEASAETIAAEFAAAGWRCFTLDAATWQDKATLLTDFQTALALPAYFGRNWDALEETLNDLAWAPAAGYAVLIDHVAAFASVHPAEWHMLLAILTDVIANWAKTATPLYVLLRGARRYADVPWLY